MNRTTWLSVAAVSGMLACACGAGSTSPPPTTRPDDRTQAESADYEVHEWGLVRADVGDTLQYGAVAPPVVSMMAVDKPLLYFHAASPITLRSVSVEARSGGTLIESWPPAHEGATARWENVSIDPSGPCEPSPLPRLDQAPCAGLDRCETASLASARVADAACVHVGSSVERFLFYRGRASSFTPPLSFARVGANETVRVTNEGDQVIPGMLVRIRRDGVRTRTLAVEPPAPHRSIDVGADFDAADESDDRRGAASDMPVLLASGPGRASMIATMRTIGLSVSESNAFMTAWDTALFGAGTDAIDVLTDGEPSRRESFVYFLPAGALENLAHVELDPAPSHGLHRAIAMWSMLSADGVSR